jgi:hypothetical protein
MRNLLSRYHCMRCFYNLFEKPAFTVGSIYDELAAYHAAETESLTVSQKVFHVRLVAEIVANNEELHVFGIRFRYWLTVNSSTIYKCRCPLILGIVDVHISLLVLFVVFQQLHFQRHSIDALLHTCPWIGSWTSIVKASLCQRASGGSWISKPYRG